MSTADTQGPEDLDPIMDADGNESLGGGEMGSSQGAEPLEPIDDDRAGGPTDDLMPEETAAQSDEQPPATGI